MSKLLSKLTLKGLSHAPSQTWRGIRLVPLIRNNVVGDLRIGQRQYDESLMSVKLDGRGDGMRYTSYVPHGLVVEWDDDGCPVAAFGANLKGRDGKRFGSVVRLTHRMAKREDKNTLRILPLHVAMEGFLSLHFGGPDIAWAEYSKDGLRNGLSPRSETSVPGRWIMGLRDALRVFEIHENQVGVAIYVADAMASIFVVSHPDDYRRLHSSLLEDFYGELLFQYGLYGDSGRMEAELVARNVETLDDLEQATNAMRAEWASFHQYMSESAFERPLISTRVYKCGPFQLQRFSTTLDPKAENHIGEAIVRQDGEIEYLKTYRLTGTQARRAHLLSKLAAHNWNLEATAAAMRQSKSELILRLERAGFAYLLKDHVIREARRRR